MKQQTLDKLDEFIEVYSNSADKFCKCLAEKNPADCELELDFTIRARKAIDVPLMVLAKEKYIDTDEYNKIDAKISAITGRITNCMKDADDEATRKELGIELHDESSDAEESKSAVENKTETKIVKTIKEPKVVPVEEEHHHDDPY